MDEKIINDSLIYQGKTYQTGWLNYNNYYYCFSTTLLEDRLLNSTGNYINEQAQLIDERIVYYLDEEEQKNVSYQSLLRYAELIL